MRNTEQISRACSCLIKPRLGSHVPIMPLLHSSSPSLVEQENIDTEYEATISEETVLADANAIIDEVLHAQDDAYDGQDVNLSEVMQQHQQVILF